MFADLKAGLYTVTDTETISTTFFGISRKKGKCLTVAVMQKKTKTQAAGSNFRRKRTIRVFVSPIRDPIENGKKGDQYI